MIMGRKHHREGKWKAAMVAMEYYCAHPCVYVDVDATDFVVHTTR
jgi:hypothetical protein